MKIYFDENLPDPLIKALAILQNGRASEGIEVLSIKEEFGRGTPDEVWIPKIAQQHGVAITQDKNINRRKPQWDLCRQNKIGIIFVRPPKKRGWSYWEMIVKVIGFWKDIKEQAARSERPFALEITATSNKIKRISS